MTYRGLRIQPASKASLLTPARGNILKAEDLITAPAHIVMKGETLSVVGPRTMVEQ